MNEPPPEFLEHVRSLSGFASQNLNEADTRVYLIDPVLRILGYVTVGDVRREVPVPATREFIDYELYAGGKAQAIIEAKAVRLPVTDAAAAQCVQYASILGVRWCLVTNGVTWAIYNAYAAGPLSEKRVASVRLDGTQEEIREAWEVLWHLRRDSLANANPLSKLLAERVIADELLNRDSQAVQALRRAVRARFNERISGDAVVEIIERLLGKSRRAQSLGKGGTAMSGTSTSAASKTAGTEPAEAAPGKPGRKRNMPRRPDGSRVEIPDLIQAGVLHIGDRLTIRVGDQGGEGRVVPEGIEVSGTVYENPTAAARAITTANVNAWKYWKLGDRPLADIRAEFLQRLAAKSP